LLRQHIAAVCQPWAPRRGHARFMVKGGIRGYEAHATSNPSRQPATLVVRQQRDRKMLQWLSRFQTIIIYPKMAYQCARERGHQNDYRGTSKGMPSECLL
jgi:hypothetical protein